MKKKGIPVIITLVACLIACVVSIVQGVSFSTFFMRFLIVFLVFGVLSIILSVVINMNFRESLMDEDDIDSSYQEEVSSGDNDNITTEDAYEDNIDEEEENY